MAGFQDQGNEGEDIHIVCSEAIDFTPLRVALTTKTETDLKAWLFDVFGRGDLPANICEALTKDYGKYDGKYCNVIGLVLSTWDFEKSNDALQAIDELEQIFGEFKIWIPPSDTVETECIRIASAVSDDELAQYYKNEESKMSPWVKESIYHKQFLYCLNNQCQFALTEIQDTITSKTGLSNELFLLRISSLVLQNPSKYEKAVELIDDMNVSQYRPILDVYRGISVSEKAQFLIFNEDNLSRFLMALEREEEIEYTIITKFFRAINDLQERITAVYLEEGGITYLAYEFALVVAVYIRLKSFQPSELASRAILYMEMQSTPICDAHYHIQNHEDITEQISQEDFLFFAQHIWEYCVCYLFAFRESLAKLELRSLFLYLLCLEQDEGSLLQGIFEEDEYSDINDVFKLIFYSSGNKQSVAAAYRIMPTWLNARNKSSKNIEKWALAPNIKNVKSSQLIQLYCGIIDDIVNHDKYKDEDIAKRLTTSLYRYLKEIEYQEIPSPVLFFVAYFTDNNAERIALYEKVIVAKSDYADTAAHNIIAAYLKIGQLDKAKIALEQIRNEAWKTRCAEQITEFERKTRAFQEMIPSCKEATEITDIRDTDLLYLYAACSGSHSANSPLVEHCEQAMNTWLSPDYYGSHKIIYSLMKKSLLRVEGDAAGKLKETHATAHDITSLPLRPNVIGFYEMGLFLENLREEIEQRDFAPQSLDEVNAKLKVGWLLNAFDYQVEKYDYADTMRAFTVEEMDLIGEYSNKFSAAQLSSLVYSAVNFVAGSQRSHRFGNEQAANRIINRLLKTLPEFSSANFVGKTFGRNKVSVFGLESALYLADGKSMGERYET